MEVAEWFGGAERILFVHAHPDDETLATGGTIAALAEAGRRPAVLTLTRGERGEVWPGREPSGELAELREHELAAALVALGVQSHAFLGHSPARGAGLPDRRYLDSGMRWGPDGRATAAEDVDEAALTRASASEALADLVAVTDAWDIDAVVSYDAVGGYGHPDHVFAHRAARAVAFGLDVPFWEIVVDPERPAGEIAGGPVFTLDVGNWSERKVAALGAYRTQLSLDGEVITHVGGQKDLLATLEYFRKLSAPGVSHRDEVIR
jgi:N-acetyl-1-D-myo-inositol-2-amino-2-deoxy-alpha-D-glucopyranoside deacetylase